VPPTGVKAETFSWPGPAEGNTAAGAVDSHQVLVVLLGDEHVTGIGAAHIGQEGDVRWVGLAVQDEQLGHRGDGER